MNYKTVEINENRSEKIHYPENGFPVIRMQNALDDFFNGEIGYHWHSEFQFGLLLKGELDYCVFRNPISKLHRSLQAGDGFFINSKVLHGYRQTKPGSEIFLFGIPVSFFSSLSFGNAYQKIVLPILHSSVFGAFFPAKEEKNFPILRLFREFHTLDAMDNDYELHSMELLCRIWRQLSQMLGEISRPGTPKTVFTQEQRMNQMLRFVKEHYNESLTVDQIAQAGGVSRRECFRCFQSSIAETPTEYLNSYRLERAAYLLTSTDHNLSAICEACGFNNTSYFGKLFKQRYGTSPGRFRLLAQY